MAGDLAYNEEGAVEHTIDDVRRELNAIGIPYEIIVIDDGSSNRTLEIARNTWVVVDTNQVNTGYGASLKRGIKHAQYEYVAIIHAGTALTRRVICPRCCRCAAIRTWWSATAGPR